MIRDFSTGNTPALRSTAQAWLTGEHGDPAPVRPAATVMIVRDTAGQEAVGASPVEVLSLIHI